MEQTVVQSYVRNKNQQIQSENTNNAVGYLVGGSVLALTLIVFWQVLLPVALVSTGAVYGVKVALSSTARSEITEAVTPPLNAPKAKRHYAPRLTVNNYQSKTVRV